VVERVTNRVRVKLNLAAPVPSASSDATQLDQAYACLEGVRMSDQNHGERLQQRWREAHPREAAYADVAHRERRAPKAVKTAAVPQHDGLAIASLVLSLVWLGGLGSFLAVIFGHSSRGAAKRAGRPASGLATAGIILGWIGLVVIVLVFVAFV
jgi:hypothetical protein